MKDISPKGLDNYRNTMANNIPSHFKNIIGEDKFNALFNLTKENDMTRVDPRLTPLQQFVGKNINDIEVNPSVQIREQGMMYAAVWLDTPCLWINNEIVQSVTLV